MCLSDIDDQDEHFIQERHIQDLIDSSYIKPELLLEEMRKDVGVMKDGTSLDSQLEFGKQKAKSLGMEFEHHDERSASSSKDHLDN